jgi:hypothetical protein
MMFCRDIEETRMCVSLCVCVCVCERERERETERDRERQREIRVADKSKICRISLVQETSGFSIKAFN